MNTKPSTVEEILNTIASQIPLIDKSDLSALTAILSKLEMLCAAEGLPKAFQTLAKRAADLTGNMIMDETPLDIGCKKLTECVTKMNKGLVESGVADHPVADTKPETEQSRSQRTDNPVEAQPQAMQDEMKDLLVKFTQSQQSVLEDFEAYVLELEKGNPEAKGAIKRTLHTWKGEFGVLDMQDYSRLIHAIEDALEAGVMTTEQLLHFKDFLQDKFSKTVRGVMPALLKSEKNAFLSDSSVSPQRQNGDFTENKTDSSAAPAVHKEEVGGATALAATLNADPSLLSDFVNESRDHIHTAETYLLELETDPSNTENINSVFRAWHTIKGVAGFLGLKEIGSLAHSMENLMDRARKNEILLNAEFIDVLLEGNDCLKECIGNVEQSLSGAALQIPEKFAHVLKVLSSPISGKKIDAPSTSPEKKVGELLIETGAAGIEEIQKALDRQKNGDTRKIGEILIQEEKIPTRSVATALAGQTAARQAASVEETIRVPVNRIDQLVDAIGEAVIAQSMINAAPSIKCIDDQALHTKIAHCEMIMRQIQEFAMSLRMVSIKSTFQKMARLVRDLSKKSGKEVNFITEGEDTELDKSVVENIGDPLIHMIRNSVDHGIESAEDRKKTAKPPIATVLLKAYHKAGNIYIEVRDDGKGLDRDAILAKAQSKGLCKPGAALSDQEIFSFIFLPGFSTAKVVTDVSGRGVGMDVVKRNIEALRGFIEIKSVQGEGTAFTIRLPLTLAIVDGMIVRSMGELYIVPTLSIVESLVPTIDQRKTVLEKGTMINVRGDLIPLVNLVKIFDKHDGLRRGEDCVVMIVEDMLGKKIGLEIDEIIGQQQVVIKNLGVGIGDVAGISGGAIMSDGNVSLILDIDGISKMVEG